MWPARGGSDPWREGRCGTERFLVHPRGSETVLGQASLQFAHEGSWTAEVYVGISRESQCGERVDGEPSLFGKVDASLVGGRGADSSERRNTEVSEVVVGAVRKTRRGVMWVEKQEWFTRLIAQGVSNAEACRIVRINRKTGTRWRYGRTIRNTAGEAVHYPPVRLTTPTVPHPRYLSITERTTIADLHDAGVGVRRIAAELGRSASTVSRELRRNTDGRGRYLPAGHRAAAEL